MTAEVLDGNKSDVKWNKDLLKKLPEYLRLEGKRPVYVADAALVSKGNLKLLASGRFAFISRFPARFNLEKQLIDRAWEEGKWQSLGALTERKDAAKYKVCSFEEELYDHEYRFVVVSSTSLDRRRTKGLEKRLDTKEERLQKELAKLGKRQFACEPDAHEAWRAFDKENKDPCFCLEYEIKTEQKRKKRTRPGRPPKDYVPEYDQVYRIVPKMRRNSQYIQKQREKASCFVLISKPPSNDITDEYILRTYKEQTVVERHFAFIKDPKVIGPVYMKKPQRVEALAYVFLIALLVYSVLQRRVRQAMQSETEPLILVGKVKSDRPTGERVLELLNHMLVIKMPDGTRMLPDNMPVPERLLRLIGVPQDVFTRLPDT